MTMKTVILFLLLVLNAGLSFGQSALFSPVEERVVPLGAAQRQVVDKAKLSPYYKNVQLVQTGKLADVQKNGRLSLVIPGQLEAIDVTASRVEAKSSDEFTWYGKTNDGGSVVLIGEKGKLYGHISIYKTAYRLEALGGDLSLMAEIDKSSVEGNQCPSPATITNPAGSRKGARLEACADQIRVLVLSTQRARQDDSNISQTINTAINQFNSALVNSQITDAARLTLAGYVPIEFTETGDISRDVNTLAGHIDVQQFRNDFIADIVVLLTNRSYRSVTGAVKAIDASQSDAYAICVVGAAANEYVFAHEVGHLFGGGHEDDFRNPQPYAHGKRFDVNRWPFVYRYSTLMHTDGTDYLRILNFSNPNVAYQGATTGDATVANVARRIAERASTVASFRTSPTVLTARIAGPYVVGTGESGSWEAVYSCAPGPYSFEWATSTDGFNYSFSSSSEILTTGQLYQTTYLRLIVTSGDGQRTTVFFTVAIDDGGSRARLAAPSVSIESMEGLTNIYPNPAAHSAHVDFTLGEPCSVRLELLDNNGRLLRVLADGSRQLGSHTVTVDLVGLPTGSYICKLSAGGATQSQRLVVIPKILSHD
jgi:peptidyl-Asp metalloendopeptidase